MSLRDELIQVAAVAVAFIENLDSGIALTDPITNNILKEVWDERLRQDAKYGARMEVPEYWLTVLVREVGEVAQAIPGVEQIREGAER